jgi:hypothetical protein
MGGEHSAMRSGGKGTRAIHIGRFQPYQGSTEFDNWGRKRCKENYNGSQQFPNRNAKLVTSGSQEAGVAACGISDQ